MVDITPAHLEVLRYLQRSGRIFRHWTDTRWRDGTQFKPVDAKLTADLVTAGLLMERCQPMDLQYRFLVLTPAGRLKAQMG